MNAYEGGEDCTTAIPQILVRVAGVPGVASRAMMRMKVRAMSDAMRMWRRRLRRGRVDGLMKVMRLGMFIA